ncbi:MAG TPA: sigma-70 family RNA polymerase sigma factor [Mycobacteriales bacterium]|nr:sigma-70 family RNA polymerase sigma factor [Mycobacteriales bacterium]
MRSIDVLPASSDEARASDDLVEEHLSLARMLAGRLAGRGESLEDLEQVARLGLVRAARRFDPGRGTPFAAYATVTIVGELKHHFRDHRWAMRVPRRAQELYLRLRTEREALTHELGRAPTIAELAQRTESTDEQVVEALDAAATFSMTSLDAPEQGDRPARSMGTTEPAFELLEELSWLRPALTRLPARSIALLRMRFVDDLTQREIGERLGVSQMQVSRLLQQILEQLRGAAA